MITSVVLWVEAKFPNFNDWIAAAKKGRGKFNAYSQIKDSYDRAVALQVSAQNPPAFKVIHIMKCTWVEKNLKRDPDNFISGGKKPLLDGLILAGVIPDDGWKYICAFADGWKIGDKPGVLVSLEGETDGNPARPIPRKYPRAESRPSRTRNGRRRAPVTTPRKIYSSQNLKVEPSSGCLALINGMDRIPTDD